MGRESVVVVVELELLCSAGDGVVRGMLCCGVIVL